MKLSIVIPCYNELENIPLILERFAEVITNQNIEVIMVDNGSTDGSDKLLKELVKKYEFAKIKTVKKNQGYGYGILQGLKSSKGDFLGWTHADMQTDPNDVIRAYEILKENNFDKKIYIKGNRKKRPFFDVIFTFGMGIFETLYLRTRLSDINAQPNIFSREFYNTWQKPPYDFSLDLYVYYLARKAKLKIIKFPVLFTKRLHGSSHWNNGSFKSKYKFIKRTLNFSKKLKKEGIK